MNTVTKYIELDLSMGLIFCAVKTNITVSVLWKTSQFYYTYDEMNFVT